MNNGGLPYFDFLLRQLARHDPAIETSFGRHVHWGYWPEPASAVADARDYAEAAERLTRELCGLAGLREGSRILDVGCGFGGTLASLNETYRSLELTGLNIDGRQLERARTLVQPLHGNRVAFCQGDAVALPFPDRAYDSVLAVECIFHFPSRERFFQEAFRVLQPGGCLALSDFVPSTLFQPMARMARWAPLRKFNYFGQCDVGYNLRRYRRLAEATGFQVEVMRDITPHTLPTYRYLRHLLGGMDRHYGFLVDWLQLIGRLGLLNYYLMAFRKP